MIRGICLSFARLLLSKKCNVVFADIALRPEAKEIVSAHSSPSSSSGRAIFQETDVREWTQLERMFQTAISEFGDVDVVCPGAGVYEPVYHDRWSTNLYKLKVPWVVIFVFLAFSGFNAIQRFALVLALCFHRYRPCASNTYHSTRNITFPVFLIQHRKLC